ncbi:telomere-protecting terminal protein Tpg [Streptomyces sp. SCL15-6]|uniref:telomere-protecting terminal protein Tpg n=1 Tax=Streptomyces sp. SCL15-6 TaxID=2967222 RepID=UPI00398F8EC0
MAVHGTCPHGHRGPTPGSQASRQDATSTGLLLDTRARFGFTAAPGTTDDARIRHLTLALPLHHTARLLDAQDQGADEQRLRALAAEAFGEVCFRDGGRRAVGLKVEFTDVEQVQSDLWNCRTSPHPAAMCGALAGAESRLHGSWTTGRRWDHPRGCGEQVAGHGSASSPRGTIAAGAREQPGLRPLRCRTRDHMRGSGGRAVAVRAGLEDPPIVVLLAVECVHG